MTVDSYLDNLSPDQQTLMNAVRKAILDASPQSQELISYGVPGYKFLDHPLIYFAAFKNHCSIFGMSKKILSDFKSDLANFKISGSSIHFTPDNPISAALVKKLVKARMKETEERWGKKKK